MGEIEATGGGSEHEGDTLRNPKGDQSDQISEYQVMYVAKSEARCNSWGPYSMLI